MMTEERKGAKIVLAGDADVEVTNIPGSVMVTLRFRDKSDNEVEVRIARAQAKDMVTQLF